jgi:glycosyltransferase involved in cell wall biosynthesis
VCVPDHSFAFSRMHAERLAAEGHRAPITRLTGEYEEPPDRPPPSLDGRAPLVVFAGRHIPEKRVPAIPPAIAQAREKLPELRCLILGDGPETGRVRARVRELELESAVEVRGRVGHEEVLGALAGSSCVLLPSEREGYGLVVVEGVSLGTPAVVVAGAENAATELIEPGVNGVVARSAEPEPLAEAIVQVIEGAETMRRSTADWYGRHARELSIESSLEAVEGAYARFDQRRTS